MAARCYRLTGFAAHLCAMAKEDQSHEMADVARTSSRVAEVSMV